MKKTLLSLVISVLVAFSSTGVIATEMRDAEMRDANFDWNNSMSPAGQAIEAAKAENKKAKKVSFEWRDTSKMIKKATKLAKAGKIKEAIKLAKKAKRQAMNAQHQAMVAKNAGPHLF